MDVVVLGAAGHGREVAACLRLLATGEHAAGELRGFLDDDPARHGTLVGGLPVLGGGEVLEREPLAAVLGVGYPEVKHRVLLRWLAAARHWPAVIHPRAVVGPRVAISRGALVQAGCIVTVDVILAEFATINVGATVSHDCCIHRLATVSPGAHLGGNVVIEEGAFIGLGASIVQGVTVGAWSVVGAGAVVTRNVPPNTVVAGTPARVLRVRPADWQNA